MNATGALTRSLPRLAKRFFRDFRHTLRLEVEFSLEFFKRGRGAECFHADDAAEPTHVTLPA